MQRILHYAILLTMFMSFTAYGNEFKLSTVSVDNQQAVLVNAATGEARYIEIGDEIEGWKVTAIKKDSINVTKLGGQGLIFTKKIPLNGKRLQQIKTK